MQIWESPAWPNFRHNPSLTEGRLAAFSARLGAITGLHHALTPDERREAFLRAVTTEAVSSFAIEGASLPAAQVQASVVASMAHRSAEPVRRSDAIADLMLQARAGGPPLDTPTLWHWHRLLFHGLEVEDKGRWRRFAMVITRSATAGRDEILYAAPPADRVPAMMDDFLTALQTDDRPAPIRAALAHLWFESIHPFSDGNGRLGRALVEHVFARDGAALPFSLSRQIEADKRGYYAALQAGRQVVGAAIDATPFVLWFLDRLIAGVDDAVTDARFLVARNAFFLRHRPPPRAERVLRRLFAEGPARVAQGISAAPYGRIAGVSAATATRDLTDLEAAGILRRGPEGGRSTRYLLVMA